MQCKLIVELEVHEPTAPQDLLVQCVRRGSSLFAPAGTIITDPQCWRIVLMGQARPHDEECEQATKRTPEQIERAEYAAARLAKGIHPDDFERYDRGELIGYTADGRDIIADGFKTDDDEEDE